MAKKRVTRKQLLKEPDEFITTTGRLIAWSKANAKSLGIGATVFFVAVIAVSLHAFINEKRSSIAQMMLGQALVKFQAEMGEKDGASAMSAVSEDFDELIKSYGSQPAGKLGRLFYGHIGVMAKDYDTAIEYYEKALDDFGDKNSLSNFIHHGLGSGAHRGRSAQLAGQGRAIDRRHRR